MIEKELVAASTEPLILSLLAKLRRQRSGRTHSRPKG
jgi:hypothetical protein